MKITFLLAHQQNTSDNRNLAMFAEKLYARGHDIAVIAADGKPENLASRLKGMLGMGHKDISAKAHAPFQNDLYTFGVIPGGEQIRAEMLPDADVLVATCWKTAHLVHGLPVSKGTPIHFAQSYEGTRGNDTVAIQSAWKLPMFRVASSRKLADFALKQLGVEIYHVIHNSIDTSKFAAPPRSRNQLPRVGFRYSGEPEHGTDLALAALETLRRSVPDLEALCFSTEEPDISLQLPAWIAHREVHSEDDIRKAFNECDLWLHSSTEHEFGMLPLSAMACRCPVVSNPVGVLPELIENGRNGYVTYMIDDSALSDAMSRVIEMSDDKWQQVSDYAQKTAHSYDWDEAAELMEYTLMVAVDHDSRNTLSSSELAVAA